MTGNEQTPAPADDDWAIVPRPSQGMTPTPHVLPSTQPGSAPEQVGFHVQVTGLPQDAAAAIVTHVIRSIGGGGSPLPGARRPSAPPRQALPPAYQDRLAPAPSPPNIRVLPAAPARAAGPPPETPPAVRHNPEAPRIQASRGRNRLAGLALFVVTASGVGAATYASIANDTQRGIVTEIKYDIAALPVVGGVMGKILGAPEG